MTRKLYLYRSNRAEELTRGLAAVLSTPVADPMRAERVVVQGRGMATWLSQQLAERLGVFTNAEFLYPRNFIQLAFDEVLSGCDLLLPGEVAAGAAEPTQSAKAASTPPQLANPARRDALFWGVFSALALLPEAIRTDPHQADLRQLKPVLDYYASDASGLRAQQLATRLARCFDQYLVFRPDLLRAWSLGEQLPLAPHLMHTARWQAALWRRLPQAVQHTHIANLEPLFQARVDQLSRGASTAAPGVDPRGNSPSKDGAAEHGLPQRICVFGLTSLPPLYLRTLTRLADLVEVHVFNLAPSRAWFADQLRPRQQARGLARGELPEAQPHTLLASLGQVGADFQQLLEEHAPGYQEPEELFVDPHGDAETPGDACDRSLLRSLQRGILDLDEGQVDGAIRALLAGAADTSLSLHSCHGPMREVEVLHDVLLGLLEQHPDLAPQDIAVMAPDIERYAPLIEAVFERPRRLEISSTPAERYIPYRIADRSVRHDAPVLEGVRRVCALVGGRRTASQLLDLLNLSPIAERFGVEAADVDQLAEWIQESGIRWGIDAEDRAQHAQPAIAQNTWRFGLDRLLLGYGLPGRGRELFAECLPFDELEGQTAELAGKLAAFAESLFHTLEQLEAPRAISAWQQTIALALGQLFAASGDYAWQHQRVLSAMENIRRGAETAGFEASISLSVLTPLLEEQLDETQPAKSFLTGGVTFCAMVPMRSIPFRVVCLLGMDEGAFPRREPSVDFDLVQATPRPGDRSRALDDRYLFLEALLSTRERLVITYSGQSIRDNSHRPPSVVIDELLDHLEGRAALVSSRPVSEAQAAPQGPPQVRARLVTRHPLQAFSRRYFDGATPGLFSYRRDLCRGAESALGERGSPAALFERRLATQLPEAAPQPTQRVRVSDLARFIARPVEYLLERRLGVYLRDYSTEILDREPLELNPLEQYAVGDDLLQLSLADVDEDQALRVLRAAGKLPFGTSGAVVYDSLASETRALQRAFAQATAGALPSTHPASIELPCGVLLEGNIERVYGERLVRARFVRPSAKRLLPLWVEHLVWCATYGGGGGNVTPIRPAQSVLLLRAEKRRSGITRYTLRAASEPIAILDVLCRLMLIGDAEPLQFFPEAAAAMLEAERAGKDGMHSAGIKYREELRFDPYLHRVFGEDSELSDLSRLPDAQGPEFAELARSIFEPLLAHTERS